MLGGTKNDIKDGNANQQAGGDIHGIAPEQHERMMEKALAALRGDLEETHAQSQRADTAEHQLEVQKLQIQITEFERRLADPEAAYQKYQATIAELQQLLEEATVDIGGNRIRDAQVALAELDYSKADEIFAEVEQLEQKAVMRAAHAAHGRGLVAEEQVRWGAAAEHYSKAARLEPSYDNLIKAGTFLWYAGRYNKAVRIGEELVDLTRREYGDEDMKTATALNNLAQSYHDKGDFTAAEPLMREALEIARKALGVDQPSYAAYQSNLAGLLYVKGDFTAAEPLMCEALEIDRKALGADHPNYAIRLNNLAQLLYAKGDTTAAELLMREALVVFEAALGEAHPNSKVTRRNWEALLRAKPAAGDA